jgi:2-iminoacetate synthase
MSFYDELIRRTPESVLIRIDAADRNAVMRALNKEKLTEDDFVALLSPVADEFLEAMAQKAHDITLRYFGKTVQLFTPLYLSNFCVNGCVYCGFNTANEIPRGRLEFDEAEREAKAIAKTGLKHVLLLTGESSKESPVEYIAECVKRMRKYFESVSVEIYPLEKSDYHQLISAGCDGLTIFQEVYDETLYSRFHPRGPKRNYRYRLDAPERGCAASMRTVSIGALLGLGPWRCESFLTGLHAAWLQKHYPDVSIGLSLPRIRPHTGSFIPQHPVSDRELIQIMLAMRIFLPNVSITISTRERDWLRDNMVGIGMTRMSAGVSTGVGGRSAEEKTTGQFDISDPRSVDEVCEMLTVKGYQPVLKDWMQL